MRNGYLSFLAYDKNRFLSYAKKENEQLPENYIDENSDHEPFFRFLSSDQRDESVTCTRFRQ
jgi:hypothetical protein